MPEFENQVINEIGGYSQLVHSLKIAMWRNCGKNCGLFIDRLSDRLKRSAQLRISTDISGNLLYSMHDRGVISAAQ